MLKIGLVGAGPWAQIFHGPMLAKSPEFEFEGVWARRSEAASSLAANFGTSAVDIFDELLDRCDALAFSVPPDVQAPLATQAARRGKHLLLEKPLALDLAAAAELAEAVTEAGVISQMVFTNRYRLDVRKFIAEAQGISPIGATVAWISNAVLPGGFFATPWRVAEGALPDIGPHALDLLDAVLGEIVDVRAIGCSTGVLTLVCQHSGGAQSTSVLSLVAHEDGAQTRFEIFGADGAAVFGAGNPQADETGDVLGLITSEFSYAIASGEPHPLDVHRGLYIQGLLAKAAAQL